MAVNDIYRVTCVQRYNLDGPLIHNVFYYSQITSAPSEGASPLLANFEASIRPLIQAIQNEAINWLEIRVENVVPSADNDTSSYTPGTVVGSRVGDCLPPYATWSFRYNRTTSAVRNGQKRFAGVSEADQNDGVAVGAFLVTLDALATALDNILGGPPPAIATYQPRIFRAGRPAKTIPAKTIPAMAQAVFDIDSVIFTTISTQNTRKFGSGI